MQLLAGDIGGTHTRLRLGEWVNDRMLAGAQETYPSQQYSDLISIVETFLHEQQSPRIDSACFAVAGPVLDQGAKVTNLPWQLKSEELAAQLNIEQVVLVNDFEAAAWGLDVVSEESLVELQPGTARDGKLSSEVLVGAGTGFGQALIVKDGAHKTVLATEGGHADFAPRDKEELALWEYLAQRLPRVSYESILSGKGLVRLYEFYCDFFNQPLGSEIMSKMESNDPAKAISESALAQSDDMAVRALERFVRIYGAQAGNVALGAKATGGVFIGGGIAPKIMPALMGGGFVQAFNDKAPMQALLEQIPVRVVTDVNLGLLGALVLAARSCPS